MQICKVHGINGVGINGDGINGAGTDWGSMVVASTVYVGTIQWYVTSDTVICYYWYSDMLLLISDSDSDSSVSSDGGPHLSA